MHSHHNYASGYTEVEENLPPLCSPRLVFDQESAVASLSPSCSFDLHFLNLERQKTEKRLDPSECCIEY